MFESLFLNIVLVLSIKFFLFDFYLFQPIWKFIQQCWNNYFTKHFFQCPFCQGFWVGLFYSSISMSYSIYQDFGFGFVTAFLSYVYYFLTYELFYYSEQKKVKRLKITNNDKYFIKTK